MIRTPEGQPMRPSCRIERPNELALEIAQDRLETISANTAMKLDGSQPPAPACFEQEEIYSD